MNQPSTPLEHVEKLMHERRLIWADVGRALDVSSQVMNNWRARGVPSSRFAALAELLGCSMEYIATGKGVKRKSYDMPPTKEEWETLNLTAREFISRLVHQSAEGRLADKELELLKNMADCLATK